MSLCLTGLPTGPICLGGVMARVHGSDVEAWATGVSLLVAAYLAAGVLLLVRAG